MGDIVFDTEMILETPTTTGGKVESISFDGNNFLYTAGGKTSSINIS